LQDREIGRCFGSHVKEANGPCRSEEEESDGDQKGAIEQESVKAEGCSYGEHGEGARKASKRLEMLKAIGCRRSSSVLEGVAGSLSKGEAREHDPAAEQSSVIREEKVGLKLFQNPPALVTTGSACIHMALCHPQSCFI